MMKKFILKFIVLLLVSTQSFALLPRNSFYEGILKTHQYKGVNPFDGRFALNNDGTQIALIDNKTHKLNIIDVERSENEHLEVIEEIDLSAQAEDKNHDGFKEPCFILNGEFILLKQFFKSDGNKFIKPIELLKIDLKTKEILHLLEENQSLVELIANPNFPSEVLVTVTTEYHKYRKFVEQEDKLMNDIFELMEEICKLKNKISSQKIEKSIKEFDLKRVQSDSENFLTTFQEIESLDKKIKQIENDVKELEDRQKKIEKQKKKINKKKEKQAKKLQNPELKILKIDLLTNEQMQIDSFPHGYAILVMNENFEIIGATQERSFKPYGRDTKVWLKTDDNWELVFSINIEQSQNKKFISLSSDGKKIYYVDSTYSNFRQGYELDLKTGNSKLIIEDENADIKGFDILHKREDQEPLFNLFDGAVFYTTYTDRRRIHTTCDALQRLVDFENKLNLTSLEIGDFSSNRKRALFQGNIFEEPGIFYVYDFNPFSELESLDQIENDLFEELIIKKIELFPEGKEFVAKTAPMIPRTFKSRDGLDLHCYITYPKTDKEGPYPFVVDVHGGPRERNKMGWFPQNQHYADRGIGMLQINFRGSKGFGKAFRDAGNGQWGLKMIDDIEDVVLQLIEEKIIDPKRVVIQGYSYGGNAVYSALAFKPDLFVAGIAGAGDCDLERSIKDEPTVANKAYWKKLMFGNAQLSKESIKDLSKKRSPIHFVDQIKAPLLIVSPEKDDIVRYKQTKLMAHALEEHDKDVIVFKIKEMGHQFNKIENVLAVVALYEDFLKEVLGIEAEEIGNALDNAPDVESVTLRLNN